MANYKVWKFTSAGSINIITLYYGLNVFCVVDTGRMNGLSENIILRINENFTNKDHYMKKMNKRKRKPRKICFGI